MKNTNIRWIEERDLEIIDSWYEDYGEKKIVRSILPENGYGGLVAEKEDRIVAACYIYLTNSEMGYIDFLVSDKKWRGRDRWDVILNLMQACYDVAINAGCIEVWGMSLVPGVVKRLRAMECTVSKNTHFKLSGRLEPGKVKASEGYSIYKNKYN